MTRRAGALATALVFVLLADATAGAQADVACTASWFDPVRFDAILRVELSQLPPDVVAGLAFEVTACGEADAEVRIVRDGAIIDRRIVDLVDVPNAARARLLAFVTAELVRVSPLHDDAEITADDAPEVTDAPTGPETTSADPEPQVVVPREPSTPGAPRERDDATPTPTASATVFDVSKWGHQTDALRRWSLGLDHGVRLFLSAPTRQNVMTLRLAVRFVLVEVRHFAQQRLGDPDVIRFDGFDVGLGGQHFFRARHLDTMVAVVAHLGMMRVIGLTQRVFGDDDDISYDLTTRLAVERRFGRNAMRLGFDLAYVHGQRVVHTSGTTLAEAHGVAVTPFLSGTVGSRGGR